MAITKAAPRAINRAGATAKTNGGGDGGESRVASFNPASFQQGGLLDDVDVTIKEARFVEYDYDGKADKPALCLHCVLVDEGGEETSQYWSAGDTKRAQPSEDGTTIVLMPGVKGLNNKTNAALFFQSLLDQGFPTDKMDSGDITTLEGLNIHVNRVAQPKRTGLARKEGDRDPTVLVVTKINSVPWETKGKAAARPAASASSAPKGAPAKTAARTTAPSTTSNGADPVERAAEVLAAVLEESGGTVRKAQIGLKAFKHVSGDPQKSDILATLKDEDFLAGGEEMGWAYDADQQTVTAV